MKTVAERFWEKVDRSGGPDACWSWTGAMMPNGYGSFSMLGRHTSAHRAAYEIANDTVPPKGIDVCHTCDNRRCVNPAHLFLGTRRENMLDASRKGRTPQGERSGSVKLTAEQVLEIRRAYEAREADQFQLAERFGVSRSAIAPIVQGKNWKHLGDKPVSRGCVDCGAETNPREKRCDPCRRALRRRPVNSAAAAEH